MTSRPNASLPFQLVLFDVDGVLTDGSLHIDSAGEVMKSFNVRDGLAVALLHAHGIKSGVLSGKKSAALDFRIKQLGFDAAVTGVLEKRAAYERIRSEFGLDESQIAYVGDDVVDLPLVGKVGRFYAPADAHPLVLRHADHVLSLCGGQGVAREAAEHILTSAGHDLEQIYSPLINDWDQFDAVQ